jgi:hypothetical protein
MDYHAFTDESLATMHFCIRGALAADDELSRLGAEPRFRVRETLAWKKHAADLEAELLRRRVAFEPVDWRSAENLTEADCGG